MLFNHKSKPKTHKNRDSNKEHLKCNKHIDNDSEYNEDLDISHGHYKRFILKRNEEENLHTSLFPKCKENKCSENCLNFQGDLGTQGFQGDLGAQGFQGDLGAQGFQGDLGTQGFQGDLGTQGFQGDLGFQGTQGFQGDLGTQGFQGTQGPKGEIGPQGNINLISQGSIIAYSSGFPITMRARISSDNQGALVAFGNSVSNISFEPGTETILLIGDEQKLLDMAFTMPRDGIITSFSARFTTGSQRDLGMSFVGVIARIFQADPDSNLFTPIPGTTIQLPFFTGNLPSGSVASGIVRPLSIFVPEQQNILLVFTTVGSFGGISITGYARAGLNIQ